MLPICIKVHDELCSWVLKTMTKSVEQRSPKSLPTTRNYFDGNTAASGTLQSYFRKYIPNAIINNNYRQCPAQRGERLN